MQRIYMIAINGTTFSVTEAILFIPPIITTPTTNAKKTPIIVPELPPWDIPIIEAICKAA